MRWSRTLATDDSGRQSVVPDEKETGRWVSLEIGLGSVVSDINHLGCLVVAGYINGK